VVPEEQGGSVTASYVVDEAGDLKPIDLEEVVAEGGGAALVVRGGGGHVGESFPLDGERMTIGRRPDSNIFLDDVTVSRDHAMVVRRGNAHHLDDLGSLNGTYVNRRRIDSVQLADGDELQVGKYKLLFVSR
jgi:pSer/pThr/pTyr-binding forkhead associated (FHA) protein